VNHRALRRPGPSTRRAGVAAALAALALTAVLAPAVAMATGSARLQERAPSAQVKASGSGTITVVGRFSINGKIPASAGGRLAIVDRAGGAQAFLGGKPLRFNSKGRVNRRSASGILLVVGSDVKVTVGGAGLVFSMAGVGRAQFLGLGQYQLNFGPNRPWSRSWVKVAQPAPPPVASVFRRR
jgi:hypothetical protein